jgi:hypothetical protein
MTRLSLRRGGVAPGVAARTTERLSLLFLLLDLRSAHAVVTGALVRHRHGPTTPVCAFAGRFAVPVPQDCACPGRRTLHYGLGPLPIGPVYVPGWVAPSWRRTLPHGQAMVVEVVSFGGVTTTEVGLKTVPPSLVQGRKVIMN